MLSVTTVTSVAAGLQERRLIEYRGGHVRILDREKLEAAVCDCYQITKQLHANLYKKLVPDCANSLHGDAVDTLSVS
ncbi:hypothetical protein ACPOL_6875 (plasmid) [Acidisarcina polymorpha]|uniref:HTH crp-type domain-containing protein n=1 Tax=Acidisarcina polymorpha TaxID=2211140 RepID=A0A2Z5GA40_9BACT|nr:helix-turn-helix domain-containing protein [Acidisarcina polymorpha]AXC16083.1 hypothetical protein ACPOL_6875 [Acidisarcina polymorpha]